MTQGSIMKPKDKKMMGKRTFTNLKDHHKILYQLQIRKRYPYNEESR
jgi:serine protease inhibitor